MNKDTMGEASISIDICSFLGSANLFFVGILIAGINNFDKSIRIAILFLVVSAISFIFSSLIYARSSGQSRVSSDNGTSFVQLANSISEYLGVYPLIYSIPIVINSVSNDLFISLSVTIVISVSLLIYTLARVSMAYRQFGPIPARFLGFYVFLQVILSSIFQKQAENLFLLTSVLFVATCIFVAIQKRNRL